MLAPPDTVKVATNLCQGEIFSYGGQQYTTSGTFYQSHDGPGMCDTIIEIRIAPRTLNVVIPDPDTLFCNGNQVMLGSTVSGASGPFNYLWTTTFGNITTSPTQAIITVDQAGPYMLSVTDGICNGVASVNVVASQGFPQVFVEGGTLTCNQTSLTLSPVYIPSNGMVNWSGPNGFSSNQPVVTVTQPGMYIFKVTNSHGCSTSKSVEVAIDTATTVIGIYALPKDCPVQQDQLGVATGLPIVDYVWTGPNNFTGNNYSVIVTDAGTYSVTATFANGCKSSDTFDFDGDFAIPDIIVPNSDTLNCGETISLTANSSFPGVTYYWNWPGGFVDYNQTTMIQQEGTYFAVVNAPNGCFNSAPVDIVSGPDVFPYQVFTDTLTCNNDSARIGVLTAVGDLFQWLNYAGPGANQSSIQVGTPGTYTVMITDTNSMCVLNASIAVVANFAVPDFGYILDTVSCLHPQAHLSFVPYGGFTYTNVYWELPDLTLVPGPNLFSNQPGDNH
ncbi:MAG TPA: hypothetical protein VJ508_02440, partial [Saprospiraceae bacterium]|nr:hypothetical protein [Saprospiraceae bacterium]